jgi:tRNA G18 (ribose-2'-O)-methylase SpoU
MNQRGFFGIGVEHTKHEQNIGTLFRSAMVFGASFVYTVGRRYHRQASDTVASHRHMPLYHFADLDDLAGHLPFGCPLVGIELDDRAVPLPSFTHPETACYILGAEDRGLTARTLDTCHAVVQLPGRFCLNVAVAGSVVLYDRVTKREATFAETRQGAA